MECPICFEIVEKDKNISITKCNHIFHTDCLCTSISYNQSCPICRNPLVIPSKDDSALLTLRRIFIQLSTRHTPHVIHIEEH